ncbi:hypothetical protein AAFC00_002356 [Neodothiora populina]|uniref:U6 small nuclear RNA (adenine-(43)-N(6))-methyltransferase n=1 Tax=Neodothiora populina TaxID=2781224 RepID=A0ABR3PHD9_9PEZI
MQSLVDSTGTKVLSDEHDPNRKVTGLDVGTGASAIYALLATSSRTNWDMHATDIDDHSLTYAEKNIALNNLQARITLHRMAQDDPLIPLGKLNVETIDFTMCNPPFYTSADDLYNSLNNKQARPSAVCTGAEVEMICEGGDLGFVMRMVEESLVLRSRVQWYSSMFGKKESLFAVVDRLKEVGIDNWAVSCLQAGNRTRRWALAWSFRDRRPSWNATKNNTISTVLNPRPTEQTIPIFKLSIELAVEMLDQILLPLDVSWKWDSNIRSGHGRTTGNVWSRAARRGLKRKRNQDDTGNTGPQAARSTHDEDNTVREGFHAVDDEVALAFRISVSVEPKGQEFVLRWLRGQDWTLFESFTGMLKRSLREKASNRRISQDN